MLDKMKQMICERVDVAPEKVLPTSKFVEELGLSSYDLMSMIAEVEQSFQIQVDEPGASKIVTVQDMMDYIKQRRADA